MPKVEDVPQAGVPLVLLYYLRFDADALVDRFFESGYIERP
jgi:hypothetical protein